MPRSKRHLGLHGEGNFDDLKPEAAYFIANEFGERCGYIVFDMRGNLSDTLHREPWFLAFNARLTFTPAMNPQDLANAQSGIEQAVNRGATERAQSADTSCYHRPLESPFSLGYVPLPRFK